MDLSLTLRGYRFPNPVGVASGTFGYGSEYEELMPLEQIGCLYTKAVTRDPRPGNAVPRIIETPSGLVNSIGLANAGVEHFISHKIPLLRKMPCPVVANLAGSYEEDYCETLEMLEAAQKDDGDGVLSGYEVNISCPNVKCGGLALGTDPAQVERLTSMLRARTTRPLIVKLTPNVTDITEIARAAQAGGADALSLINTLIGMVIDTRTRRPVLPGGSGGLSGPAVRPVGVAATYRVSRAVSIPVIGLGGIMSADDALQYLIAGARAVQVGTANFVSPDHVTQVKRGIEDYCREHGFESIAALHAASGFDIPGVGV